MSSVATRCSKRQCSRDGYKRRVLKIPNLRFQLEIQRQREEEKRRKTKKRADRKKGSENMLAFISELSETLSARPRGVCVVPSFKVEVNLNSSPDGDGWNSHRRPTNYAAQIDLVTCKHLQSLKILTTPVCNHHL